MGALRVLSFMLLGFRLAWSLCGTGNGTGAPSPLHHAVSALSDHHASVARPSAAL